MKYMGNHHYIAYYLIKRHVVLNTHRAIPQYRKFFQMRQTV